jgi:hypothetical protein
MERFNEIKFLSEPDVPEFLDFLNQNWKRDHVFCRNRRLFDFQHKSKKGEYTFLISKNYDSKIQSVLGFIFCNSAQNSVWLAIWKSSNNSGDGFRLLKKLISLINPVFIGAIGISEDAQRLYKILGWEIQFAKHYFLNLNYPGLRKNKKCESIKKCSILKDIFNVDNNPNCLPFKDVEYYKHRFFNHPEYNYIFIKIDDSSLIFIGRIIEYLGYKVCRIVDVIGEMNHVEFKDALLNFMSGSNIDLIEMIMYDSSIPKIDMFLKLENEVIPLHTNPFLNKNINVKLGYKCNKYRVRFFIGDSDQDRPN